MTGDKWFVILQQDEIEKIKTGAQLCVFSAIKSYTANGKQEAGISLRQISTRSKLSLGWVKPVINQLIELGLVFSGGTVGRRGGMVQVFSVGTLRKSSVPPVNESVQSIGTRPPQSNKGKDNNTSSLPISLESYDAMMGLAEKLSDKHRAMRERGKA